MYAEMLDCYRTLRFYNKLKNAAESEGLKKRLDAKIAEKKHELRKNRREFYNWGAERHVVKQFGIDGYIELIELPDTIKTADEAERYFMENEYVPAPNSAYDCTGRLFSGFHKIFLRRGRYMAYHRICFDV